MNTKFFKINVDKLCSRLPQSVVFNESQKAMLAGLEENRFFVHVAARRTGKSYSAAIIAFAKLLEPGQQVMVVAPNFSLSSIYSSNNFTSCSCVDSSFGSPSAIQPIIFLLVDKVFSLD